MKEEARSVLWDKTKVIVRPIHAWEGQILWVGFIKGWSDYGIDFVTEDDAWFIPWYNIAHIRRSAL
jgi:hypothetical protein